MIYDHQYVACTRESGACSTGPHCDTCGAPPYNHSFRGQELFNLNLSREEIDSLVDLINLYWNRGSRNPRNEVLQFAASKLSNATNGPPITRVEVEVEELVKSRRIKH